MSTILIPLVERVTIEGQQVEMSVLDQQGLAIVRKIMPDAVGERNVSDKQVKEVADAQSNEEHNQPNVSNDVAGKPKRGNTRGKSKVVTDVK